MSTHRADQTNAGAGPATVPPEHMRPSHDSVTHPWRATPSLLCLMVLVFLAALHSPVDYSGSDAQGTLLSSQALVQTGTLRLDRYVERTYVPARKAMGAVSGKYRLIGDHCYYAHPVGTVITGVPWVWLANLLGENMIHAEADARLQNVLSALLVAVATFLAFNLARCWADDRTSLWLAAAFVAGSPLTSTMGTALWSSGLASIFVSLAVVRIVRHVRMGDRLAPRSLGLLLAGAFLARPTAAVLIATVMALLLVRRWRDAVTTLVFVGIGLAPLVVFSIHELGSFLPEYYIPLKRLPGPTLILLAAVIAAGSLVAAWLRLAGGMRDAVVSVPSGVRRGVTVAAYAVLAGGAVLMVGHAAIAPRVLPRPLAMAVSAVSGSLASPSRGLFVFCPWALVSCIVLVLRYRAVRRDPMLWFALTWLLLHLAAVARPFRWYGGHCFGPRVFTEAVPGLMVLALIAWENLPRMSPLPQRVARAGFVSAAILSLFINTYQGLFNLWTVRWNASPDIDLYEPDLFRWRYAQFLASPAVVERRLVDHGTARLPAFPMNLAISAADSTEAFYLNWAVETPDGESPHRRAIGDRSAIWIRPNLKIRECSTMVLELLVSADSRKRVYISVNGHDAAVLRITREPSWATANLPVELLTPDAPNEVAFEVFPAGSPASNLLPGMRLWELKLTGRRGRTSGPSEEPPEGGEENEAD